MKKVVLSIAILLVGFTTAATAASSNVETVSIFVQDSYKDISVEELPQIVKDAVSKSYPDAKIEKAAVSETNVYKLELAVGDQTATVYVDENGNFITK